MAAAQPDENEDTMDPTERTPGEWHVSEHGVPAGIYQAGIYAEGGDGRDIATVKSNATDAAIFAAAPQLLDALRDLVDELEAPMQAAHPSSIRNGRAAIAKALGLA